MRPEAGRSLDRLQVAAIILPLAYIAVLFIVIASLGLPLWAEAVAAITISLPFIFGFAYAIFGTVQGMHEEVQQRERRFRDLLESAPDAIIIVNQRGRIVMVNHQAEQIFGYAAREMLDQPVEMLIPEHLRGSHVGHRSDYHLQPRTRPMGSGLDLHARRKDGSEFPTEISLSPIESDEGVLITSVIRDITERRKLEQERERLLAAAETERERERIGMDLHDGIIQSIYAVGLNLEAAVDDVGERPDEVRGRIERAIDHLNETIRDIRSYIFQLRPGRYQGGFEESILNLAQEFRVNSLIETSVEVQPELPELDEDRRSALFHITQEALNNVRKHSRATSVAVRVTSRDGILILHVEDNGAGFETGIDQAQEHNGLRNMASRAKAAGGTLSIESAPGTGTRIEVRVPAAEPAGEMV